MNINTGFNLATSQAFTNLGVQTAVSTGSFITTFINFLGYFLIFWFVLMMANFLWHKVTSKLSPKYEDPKKV